MMIIVGITILDLGFRDYYRKKSPRNPLERLYKLVCRLICRKALAEKMIDDEATLRFIAVRGSLVGSEKK